MGLLQGSVVATGSTESRRRVVRPSSVEVLACAAVVRHVQIFNARRPLSLRVSHRELVSMLGVNTLAEVLRRRVLRPGVGRLLASGSAVVELLVFGVGFLLQGGVSPPQGCAAQVRLPGVDRRGVRGVRVVGMRSAALVVDLGVLFEHQVLPTGLDFLPVEALVVLDLVLHLGLHVVVLLGRPLALRGGSLVLLHEVVALGAFGLGLLGGRPASVLRRTVTEDDAATASSGHAAHIFVVQGSGLVPAAGVSVSVVVMVSAPVSVQFCLRRRSCVAHRDIAGSGHWIPDRAVLGRVFVAGVGIRRRCVLSVILLVLIGGLRISSFFLFPLLSLFNLSFQCVFILFHLSIFSSTVTIRPVFLDFFFEVGVLPPPRRVNLWVQRIRPGFHLRLCVLLKPVLPGVGFLALAPAPRGGWFRSCWFF